jgi:Fe-S-cluster containining protein
MLAVVRRRDPRVEEEKALLGELKALYLEVDEKHRGWSCPASTECCRFGITGREPYITSIEELALRRAIAAVGGSRALAAKRPKLPLAEERRCPALGADGRCVVYSSRPLGCRTFFCDRAEPGERVTQRDLNELVRRVQAIAARHASEGDRGRPLTRALADLLDG